MDVEILIGRLVFGVPFVASSFASPEPVEWRDTPSRPAPDGSNLSWECRGCPSSSMGLAGICLGLGLLLVMSLSPIAFLLQPRFEGRRRRTEIRGVFVGRRPGSDLVAVRPREISAVHCSRGTA
ncbi:MAG: hypothetical protein GXP34_14590 [Actinobacteria bacterium]|nr:hypothetical protein [Actinomycetota bacterium]